MATEIRELICINCPMGCPLTVTLEDGEVVSVTGNTCPRGDAYGRKEVTNPRRIVTTTVPVVGSKTEHMVRHPGLPGEEYRGFPAPLPLSPYYPPDLDRRVDSPALSGRGSRPSGRTSG